MKKIGIGVIGLGMGKNLIRVNGIESLLSEVRAICDTDEAKMNETAGKFNIPFTTQDYKQLIHRDDIDVVGVFSPDHLHFEMMKKAMEAGII